MVCQASLKYTLWYCIVPFIVCSTTINLQGCVDATPSIQVECTDSSECVESPVGNLCQNYSCTRCGSDQDCMDAPYFGSTALCKQGECIQIIRCPVGRLGCLCTDEGNCDDGQCEEEICEALSDCEIGSLGCECDEDQSCLSDLVCLDQRCTDCPNDQEGCPCVDDECLAPLICDTMMCRSPITCEQNTCAPHQLCVIGEDREASCLDECVDEYQWDVESQTCVMPPALNLCDPESPDSINGVCASQNRSCVVEDERCGPCVTGFIEEAGQCRSLQTCAEIQCTTQSRTCIESDTFDAICGDCVEGYIEIDMICTLDTRPNCSEDRDFSILNECTAQNRTCVPTMTGARCGACQEGFIENQQGECKEIALGEACNSSQECANDEACITLQSGQPARCLPEPCVGASRSWNQRTESQECITCNCFGEGLTGRAWYTTDRNGDCVCETNEGFFFNAAGESRSAEACDADQDGWVRHNAMQNIHSEDIAIYSNARCQVREIDRFVLRNEFAQEYEISTLALVGNSVFELYESNENDDDIETQERLATPFGQRNFYAAEINPLTKACIDLQIDLNDNGISDFREHQKSEVENQREWMQIYLQLGYFIELHHAWYEASDIEGRAGRYIIAERSRCNADFPLGYKSDISSSPRDGSYWRECTRQRPNNYLPADPILFDFASYNCEGAGSCPELPPPGNQLLHNLDEIPEHGICSYVTPQRFNATPQIEVVDNIRVLNQNACDGQQQYSSCTFQSLFPYGTFDGLCTNQGEQLVCQPLQLPVWRGMYHFSQFKCLEVVADDPSEINQVSVNDLTGSNPKYNYNQCTLKSCSPEEIECQEYITRDTLNPRDPIIECESDLNSQEIMSNSVALLSVRYQSNQARENYQGGCIDEWSHWPELCPGYNPLIPDGTIGQSNDSNFGELICGCGRNYGGNRCEIGCSNENLSVGGSNSQCTDGYCPFTIYEDQDEGGGRSGYWMCGDVSASAFPAEESTAQFTSPTYTITGSVPQMGVQRNIICSQTNEQGQCVCLNTDLNGNCLSYSGYTFH